MKTKILSPLALVIALLFLCACANAVVKDQGALAVGEDKGQAAEEKSGGEIAVQETTGLTEEGGAVNGPSGTSADGGPGRTSNFETSFVSPLNPGIIPVSRPDPGNAPIVPGTSRQADRNTQTTNRQTNNQTTGRQTENRTTSQAANDQTTDKPSESTTKKENGPSEKNSEPETADPRWKHTPTIDEDFRDDEIYVVLRHAYSEVGQKIPVTFFEPLELESVHVFFQEGASVNEAVFHQILLLKLKEKSKENVLAAIIELEKHPAVLSAEPEYNYGIIFDIYPR